MGPRWPHALLLGLLPNQNLGCEESATTEKRAVEKTSFGTINTPRNRQGFPPQLAFHGNRLQFEMPAPQERTRSDEFPRRQVLGREVALVNRIEFLEE